MGTDPGQPTSFEQAIAELEKLVREMESSETGLDRSMELYEQGIKLLKGCQQILEKSERKVEQLIGVDSQGNPVARPFDSTSSVAKDADRHEQEVSRSRTEPRAPEGSEPTEDYLF